MKKHFNLRRIVLFIYRDIILLRGAIVTSLSVVGGLFLIIFWISLRRDHLLSVDEFMAAFSPFYILLGLLLTFSIFKEAHHKQANQFYFALPVSALERTAATWFLASIIYTIVFTAFSFLIGHLAIGIGSLFSKTDFHVVPIASAGYWQVVKFYFLVQPAFLLGAISFSKNRIGKTLLIGILVALGLFIYNVILCFFFSEGAFDIFESQPWYTDAFDLASKDFSTLGAWLFGIVLVPVMLLAAYFKINEKEV